MKIIDYTYEDSILISDSLSDKMATTVTMEKQLKLGPNSNISYLAKKGTKVKVGDPVAVFEESFDEKEANIFLSKLGDEYREDILAQGRNTLTSKYTGEIADVEVYYTVPFEELSPSLQKIVKEINKDVEAKKKIVKQHFKSMADAGLIMPPTEQIITKDGKVKGIEVGDGVVIRIFTRYRDRLETGDKLTFFSALKGIIQQTIPAEVAPYSDFGNEDEIIEAILSPGALCARMVTSAVLNLYINKVLLELKNSIAEDYGMPRRKL